MLDRIAAMYAQDKEQVGAKQINKLQSGYLSRGFSVFEVLALKVCYQGGL
jgi:hypothetical protein